MSLQMLQALFEQLPNLDQRRLRLLRFADDPTRGIIYESRAIQLYSDSEMDKFLSDIQTVYIGDDRHPEKGRLRRYATVDEYNGSMEGTTIYSLPCSNELIQTAHGRMTASLDHPMTGVDPFEFGANAYALQGVWNHDGKANLVTLIAVMNPVKTLKHKFMYDSGTFKEISEKVLDLRLYSDVIVVGQKVFFLGMAGEKLFGMERAYRANAEKVADVFVQSAFFTDGEKLKEKALSGHYPRMLVTYQPGKMEYLDKLSNRRAIAKKFGIGIRRDGALDTQNPESAEKLLRFLCNRGMLDPTDQSAMEVTGAKRWAS